jgi:hypothetical protein
MGTSVVLKAIALVLLWRAGREPSAGDPRPIVASVL